MPDSVDGGALRRAMRRVPSVVTVVTVAGPDEARGVTIGSFTSLSLDPPLLAFNLTRGAQVEGLLQPGAPFVLHVLSEAQAHLANHFAVPDRSGAEQFDGVEHATTAEGTPVFPEACALFHARVEALHDGGDHVIVVGRVEALEEGPADVAPILYYDRSYRAVGEAVQASRFRPVKRSSSASP